MQINKLDHVNIRTTQLDVLVAWYKDVLGMTTGPRPDFPFPGAWMYVGDQAVVHLIGIDGAPGVGSEAELKMEHVAFTATGAASFKARLDARELPYQCSEIAEIGTIAYNIWDPDGNHIHVDFALDDAA